MNPSPKKIAHPQEITELHTSQKIWLFLDYDGTLASFAPTPDHIIPDPELIETITQLYNRPELRVSVISGRRLSHIQKLLPIPGILLAGSYGLEMQLPNGELTQRLPFADVRASLARLKPHWQGLLEGRENFYLEDKGWSLAIHARFAGETESEEVLQKALPLARQHTDSQKFHLLGGHKFLEIGPYLANKGETLEYLLENFSWPDSSLIYMGDDDKDEEALKVIKQHGGLGIVVSQEPRPSHATYRLPDPPAVRKFLKALLSILSHNGSS
jgi:trehalose 6-phosphate phosphatase